MKEREPNPKTITTLDALAEFADYSFMERLNRDPDATEDGIDHDPREVSSGHYVPVNPTPIQKPEYIAHSKTLFAELGLNDSLASSPDFMRMFSGDTSALPTPLRKHGWATGYALSIYGREYYEQCPFLTGNGYGDGRAISVFEGVLNGKRWEMQLKGAGRTPYCRGADGRAVLRSSVREFLAQEHMHALGIPTSRSLSLYRSRSERVHRPWYSENSHAWNPDTMVLEHVAITTRVAPSFIRVGQIELFGRRARKNEHPKAMQELEQIVLHLIEREYSEVIEEKLSTVEKVLLLAQLFRDRLTSLVANWIRVGYCQGNFNSDNCAAGGFTLDYGPFGFCEAYDPEYQPWTGGGKHFSFRNQPHAAQRNFYVFCMALQPLLREDSRALVRLGEIHDGFSGVMQEKMEKMWAGKLGLDTFDAPLFHELEALMRETAVDYIRFFRALSHIPETLEPLKKSFYGDIENDIVRQERWSAWLGRWRAHISSLNHTDMNAATPESRERLSCQMKQVNPKYTLREWHLVSAYEDAKRGDYARIRTLQEVMSAPYDEQSKEVEERYDTLKPAALFDVGGVSHISCSS